MSLKYKERYIYKGKYYYLIDDSVRKCPTTREWIGVVLYKQFGDETIYVRDGVDFYANFRKDNTCFKLNFDLQDVLSK